MKALLNTLSNLLVDVEENFDIIKREDRIQHRRSQCCGRVCQSILV